MRLNGCAFTAGDAEIVVTTIAMAAGELPDDKFIAWVRLHAQTTSETATSPRTPAATQR